VLGKNRKIISIWERGARLPTGPVLLKLAKALSTFVESLYHGIYSSFHPSENDEQPPA
jgi:transcriptional regulator with XRE-family HTH domain